MASKRLKGYIGNISNEEFQNLSKDEAQQIASDPLVDAVLNDEPKHVDSAGEIEGKVEEINKLTEVEASLEAYLGILSQEKQGIGRDAAAVLAVGLQRISNVLGPVEIPSTECFGGSMSKRQATQVSMEALGDHLKNAGEKIKAGIQQLIEMIIAFARDMVDDVENLRKNVMAMREVVSKGPGASFTVEMPIPAELVVSGGYSKAPTGIIHLTNFLKQKYLPAARQMVEIASKGGENMTTAISEIAGHVDLKSLGSHIPGAKLEQGNSTEVLKGMDVTIHPLKGSAQQRVGIDPMEFKTRCDVLLKAITELGNLSSDYSSMSSSLRKLKVSSALSEAKDSVSRNLGNIGGYAKTENPEGDTKTVIRDIVKIAGPNFTELYKYCFRSLKVYAAQIKREHNAALAHDQGNK